MPATIVGRAIGMQAAHLAALRIREDRQAREDLLEVAGGRRARRGPGRGRRARRRGRSPRALVAVPATAISVCTLGRAGQHGVQHLARPPPVSRCSSLGLGRVVVQVALGVAHDAHLHRDAEPAAGDDLRRAAADVDDRRRARRRCARRSRRGTSAAPPRRRQDRARRCRRPSRTRARNASPLEASRTALVSTADRRLGVGARRSACGSRRARCRRGSSPRRTGGRSGRRRRPSRVTFVRRSSLRSRRRRRRRRRAGAWSSTRCRRRRRAFIAGGVGERLAGEAGQQVVDGHRGHPLARRVRGRADVRDDEHVRSIQQRVVGRGRLGVGDVERRA